MSPFKYVIILFLTIGLLLSCNSDNDTPEPIDGTPKEMEEPVSYEAIMNVSYGSGVKQVYDIYLPENRTTETKVMILVHGGGWSGGDKDEMNDFKNFLRESFPELAIVNVNYRLANENAPPVPMQTNDITTVINDLKTKQDEYQIGNDLGFFGVSAGAHLSLLWSYAFDLESNVKMVCSFVGPTNLADDAYVNSENEVLQNLILKFGQDIETLNNASPLFKVTASSPPTLLFYGGMDPLVPTSQGVDLDARLTELNVVHEFTLYPNEGHGWGGDNLFDTSEKLKTFTKTHLIK
jgi:acetyl esterase/lipase